MEKYVHKHLNNCMYMCLHMYMYMYCIGTCMFPRTHVFMHTDRDWEIVEGHASTTAGVCVCVYICVSVCEYESIFTYTYIYIYTQVLYMYIHLYTRTHIHLYRERERESLLCHKQVPQQVCVCTCLNLYTYEMLRRCNYIMHTREQTVVATTLKYINLDTYTHTPAVSSSNY